MQQENYQNIIKTRENFSAIVHTTASNSKDLKCDGVSVVDCLQETGALAYLRNLSVQFLLPSFKWHIPREPLLGLGAGTLKPDLVQLSYQSNLGTLSKTAGRTKHVYVFKIFKRRDSRNDVGIFRKGS